MRRDALDHRPRRRNSLRLKGYDYAQAGCYYVTLCIQQRACLLGEIVQGAMRLSEAGRMVQAVWDDLPRFYPGVEIDAFVIMPNHIHGIHSRHPCLTADPAPVGAGPCACPDRDAGPCACPMVTQMQASPPEGQRSPSTLGDVVRRFKTYTTHRYAAGVERGNWPPFAGRLWQRNYHDHIVRSEADLRRVRAYIASNVDRWADDALHTEPQIGRPRRGAPTAMRAW
ncbi:MAG: transposase [Anaerolineae bacterium]